MTATNQLLAATVLAGATVKRVANGHYAKKQLLAQQLLLDAGINPDEPLLSPFEANVNGYQVRIVANDAPCEFDVDYSPIVEVE